MTTVYRYYSNIIIAYFLYTYSFCVFEIHPTSQVKQKPSRDVTLYARNRALSYFSIHLERPSIHKSLKGFTDILTAKTLIILTFGNH